ncbi:MAG TPA: hypothetical protein PKY96_18540, partial [Flavobacteriales bacterium]|nr:hypothetical protein [Flavobacteriales bacterium]
AAGVVAAPTGAAALAFAAASVTISAWSYFEDYDYQVRSGNQASTGQSLWNAQVVVADATAGLISGQIAAYELLDQAGEITSEMSKIGRGASGLFNASGAVNGALQLYSDVAPCYEQLGEAVYDLFNESESNTPISSLGSWDPNEKNGPMGLLGSSYHNGRSILYPIYFENVDTATAPAQIVRILDSLDVAVLDPASARLVAIGIADSLHSVPVDRMGNYFTELLYPFFNDLYARVNFTVDTTSGVLDCRFLSLDDTTNELITDPLGGFLPPNVTPPMGEGFIVVSVDLKDDVGSGVTVENRAAIIFDTNDPIITNTHSHITDFDRPTSVVDVLPDSSNSNTITVSWTSSDLTSGVSYHNVYYKEVGMAGWSTLAYQEPGTQTSFTGECGNQYSFFTLATD